jgi:hypothetical protein
MKNKKNNWETARAIDAHRSGMDLRVSGKKKAKNCGRKTRKTSQVWRKSGIRNGRFPAQARSRPARRPTRTA